jgi:site-specific recombinase XerD
MSEQTALTIRQIKQEVAPVRAEANPALVYLASLTATGRRSMTSRLASIAGLLGHAGDAAEVNWAALRFEHVAALRSRLQESGQSPASVNATLCALRGVARAAWHLGQMNAEDYQRIVDVRSVRGHRLPAGRALAQGEIAALFEACARDQTAAGARDAAALALLAGAGLRRSECAALDTSDYTPETNALRVKGKGNRERMAYLTGGTAEALADWLKVRGLDAGALLTPVSKSGRLDLRRMTDQAIYNALRKRAAEAEVKAFSPHDCRRTFVSELLDAGADIAAVQRLAGHANVQTTARYDRRGEAATKRAAALIKLPYRPRF